MNHLEGEFLPYHLTNIDEPLLQATLKEINESPGSKEEGLQLIREELKNIKDLEPCLEEDFLLRFLRVSKYDSSKAIQRILKYYKQQEKLLDAFKDLAIPLQKARSLNYIFVSPYRVKDNSVVQIALQGKCDYDIFTFPERFYLDLITVNTQLNIPATQLAGLTIIVDYEGFNFRSFRAHTPGWVLLCVETCLNAYPLRMKAIHVVNAPSLFVTFYKAISPFLTKKLKDRVAVHPKDNWTKLHSAIAPEILPEEYGGKLKFSDCINVMENIEELEDNFLNMFNYGYNNTKARREAFRPICRTPESFSTK